MAYFLIKNQYTHAYPDLHLSWYIFLSFVPIIFLCIFSTGIGLILSVLNVYFKDIEYIYSVITLMLFYVTPIMYSLKTLHKSGVNAIVMKVLMLNPLYSILEMFFTVQFGTGTISFMRWAFRSSRLQSDLSSFTSIRIDLSFISER